MTFVHFDLSTLVNAKKRRIKPPLGSLYTLIATWFLVGLIGFMPGTLGSLASFPIYYFIVSKLAGACDDYQCIHHYFFVATIITFVIGWWAIAKFQEKTNTYDHSFIVIDEVIGMLTAFALCFEYAFKIAKKLSPELNFSPMVITFFLVFIIFRYFDIRKTFPIYLIDRQFHNSFAVIIDDVLAALYTAGVIYIIFRIIV